jgi:hypothetical protein
MVSVPSSQGRRKIPMATSSAASYLKKRLGIDVSPRKNETFFAALDIFFHSPHPLISLFISFFSTKDIQASCTKESAILVLFLENRQRHTEK